MPPRPEREARIQQSRPRHVPRARADTHRVPPVVQRQADVHPHERHEPQHPRKPERPRQHRVDLRRRRHKRVDRREQQQDREMARQEMRLPQQMEQHQVPRPQAHARLPLARQPAQALPHRKPRVQRSPHVPQGLAIPRHAGRQRTPPALAVVARDVALAGRGVDHPRNDVPARGEVAFEQHVHVLANRRGIPIPPTNLLREDQGQRIDRRGDRDGASGIHGRQSGKSPHEVGAAHKHRHLVRVPIKNDGRGVERAVRLVDVSVVESPDFGEIILREMGVG